MSDQGQMSRKSKIIGFGLSAVFLCMTLWFNIAGLMTYIAETTLGWVVALLMWVANGFIFTRVQALLAAAFMDDDDEDDHHGGRRMREMEHDHAVVRIPVDRSRGPF